MSEPSHCQKCGAKFSWWWRHRHICARCNKVVCDACSEKMVYTSNQVRNLNFEKEELCNDCEPINAKELEDEKLVHVINIYQKSYEYGLQEGESFLPPEADAFFWDIENQPQGPAELVKSACYKGREMGRKEAIRREKRRELLKEAAQSIGEEVQRRKEVERQKESRASRLSSIPENQLVVTQQQEKRCSICGLPGHNAQTCPKARRCSICNGYDHDARNCPKARRCSICNRYGHDARNCPYREK